MKSLKTLQWLINFFFFGFCLAILLALLLFVFLPGGSLNQLLIELSKTGLEDSAKTIFQINYITLLLNVLRIILFGVVLYFLRKVVMNFAVGRVFDIATRNSLKYMGLYIVLLGVLKMTMQILIPYYLGHGLTLFSLDFAGVGSTYFIIAIGLLFSYMSKVLEQSALVQQENELTI